MKNNCETQKQSEKSFYTTAVIEWGKQVKSSPKVSAKAWVPKTHGIIMQVWNLLRRELLTAIFGCIRTFTKRFIWKRKMSEPELSWLSYCCFMELKRLSKDRVVSMKWEWSAHRRLKTFKTWERNFWLSWDLTHWRLLSHLNTMTTLYIQQLGLRTEMCMNDWWTGARTTTWSIRKKWGKNWSRKSRRPSRN